MGDENKEEQEEQEQEQEQEKTLEDKITDTLDYLIRHDRDEIENLLKKFDKEQTIKDDVGMLRKLTELYIDNVRLGKEAVQSEDGIDRLLGKLKKESRIPQSKLHQFGAILRGIDRNRHRVVDILEPMALALEDPEDVSRVLKDLVRKELINEEQFKQLSDKIDTLDMDELISVIKSTKVGRGLLFLPRDVDGLKCKLQEWCNEYDEDATDSRLKRKIMSVLDDLKYRKVITKKEHKECLEHLEEY